MTGDGGWNGASLGVLQHRSRCVWLKKSVVVEVVYTGMMAGQGGDSSRLEVGWGGGRDGMGVVSLPTGACFQVIWRVMTKRHAIHRLRPRMPDVRVVSVGGSSNCSSRRKWGWHVLSATGWPGWHYSWPC